VNPLLDRLHAYPFEKLRALMASVQPNASLPPISLGIGEPRHPAPALVREGLVGHLDGLSHYPATPEPWNCVAPAPTGLAAAMA